MGYKIVYGKQKIRKFSFKKCIILSCCALSAAMLLWPGGRSLLQELLLPGDAQVTASALETLVLELEQGGSMADAVTAFCQEVVAGAR